MPVTEDLTFSKHIEDVIKTLNQRTGILHCLVYRLPQPPERSYKSGRRHLLIKAKVWYGLAANNIPRVRDNDPKRRSMQDLQVSQNEVARVLTRFKRCDRVTVHHLLEKAGMTSVKRMAAETILVEI
jgi:hypothetical protein